MSWYSKNVFLHPTLHGSASTVSWNRGGGSNVTNAPGKKGVGVVASSVRCGSAMLGDTAVRLGDAGREGSLTSKEQDAQETPSRSLFRAPLCVTRG